VNFRTRTSPTADSWNGGGDAQALSRPRHERFPAAGVKRVIVDHIEIALIAMTYRAAIARQPGKSPIANVDKSNAASHGVSVSQERSREYNPLDLILLVLLEVENLRRPRRIV
jgi:hypothetical protein